MSQNAALTAPISDVVTKKKTNDSEQGCIKNEAHKFDVLLDQIWATWQS